MRSTHPVVIVISEEEPLRPVRYSFRPAARWPIRTVGIAATVLVHLLISAPLVLGVAAHKSRQPSQTGPGSVEFSARGERVESMILLDLSALDLRSAQGAAEPQIDSEGIELKELERALASLDPSPPAELLIEDAVEAETSNKAAGDPAGAAALFGNYMGQVSARIERAWRTPRHAIEGGYFDCTAHIGQDRRGNVLSIDLQGCNGDEIWKKSLISAIRRSSPLSSPPEPWLFTPTVNLKFSAQQYEKGVTAEYRYEPVSARVAMREEARETIRQISREPGDYELTIDRDGTVWKKKDIDTSKK